RRVGLGRVGHPVTLAIRVKAGNREAQVD
ncbi:MAG: hypothetical protein QOF84_3492, partial [Streptomyces sp.]|nr:hypothetical protein [Streptomyces sp.]